MSSIYQIAVRMTMTNGMSPILRTIAHDLIHVGHHLTHATMQVGRFRQAIAAAGAGFVGMKVLGGVTHLLDHGAEFLKIQNQMLLGSWKEKEIAEATAHAWELTHKYKTVSAQEHLQTMLKMAPVMGDKHHAVELADHMGALLVSMQGKLGMEKAGQFHKQIIDTVRAGELSANVLQPERFIKYTNMMVRALNAFGGTVMPSDFFMATKYGRGSALNWSDRFTEQVLPTIIQELGASSTGTAMMTMYQAVIGGRMTVRARNAWQEMGLIDDAKARLAGNLTPEGRLRRMTAGMIKDSYQFMSDPDLWMQQHMVPALIAKKIISKEGYDEILKGNLKEGLGLETMRKISAQMAIMFGDRTGQGLADMLILQVRKLQRDSELIKNSAGMKESLERWNDDYIMSKAGLHVQFENLQTALAIPNMQVGIAAFKGLTAALSELVQVFVRHPNVARAGFWGAIATGLTLVFGAIIAFGAIFVGFVGGTALVVSGLVGLAVAIGGLIWLKWDVIKEKALQFIGVLKQIPDMIGNRIKELGEAIAARFRAALGWLFKGLGASPSNAPGYTTPESAPGVGVDGMPLLQPQSYVPGRGGQMLQTRTVINLDGRGIADVVAMHVARAMEHITGPSGFDNRMGPQPVDIPI